MRRPRRRGRIDKSFRAAITPQLLRRRYSSTVDAVTSGFSGLDLEISVANADLRAPRVAKARNLPLATVMSPVKPHTHGRLVGIIGENTINVLDLNLAPDGCH